MLTEEEIELLRQIKIHRVLGIIENGRRNAICCPLPNHRYDKTPSFTIYPDGSYYCYGCKKKGRGALDFCIDMGYSFKEALSEVIKYI